MSYSIFRVQGVKTLSDLRGIGKHNKDRVSRTNPDIDQERSSDNIDLISCSTSYRQRFNEITAEMKIEHDERMATTRSDRRKTFEQAVDTAKNDVAAEFLFTSDEAFFEGKTRKEIEAWAEESLEFLQKDIGIKKEHIIQATVHMDEKTPHLHVVAVPLVKAWDGRKKADTWQISRKKFIPKKDDLSKLQDVYNERMKKAGFDLDRGDPGVDRLHVPTEILKKETQYYRQELEKAKTEYKMQLQKLEEMQKVNAPEESLVQGRITVGHSPMPRVEIKKKTLGGTKIEEDQVLALQEWGNEMIRLSEKDNQTIAKERKENERLRKLVQLQEKEIDIRVNNKMFNKENEWKARLKNFEVHIDSLKADNKELKEANTLKEKVLSAVVDFLEKLGLIEQFKKFQAARDKKDLTR